MRLLRHWQLHGTLACIKTMEKIIDKYLDELISIELNKLPGEIVPEMSDPNQGKNGEFGIQKVL